MVTINSFMLKYIYIKILVWKKRYKKERWFIYAYLLSFNLHVFKNI